MMITDVMARHSVGSFLRSRPTNVIPGLLGRRHIINSIGRIIIVSCLSFFSIGLIGCDKEPSQEIASSYPKAMSRCGLETGILKVGTQIFHLELADNIQKRQKGLMFREHLGLGCGMLFFDPKRNRIWPVWMKNMLIPLDIVWITEEQKVVDIQTASPCEKDPCPKYAPKDIAKYMLEVNAGEFRGQIGDRVEITID